jgi:hypothetical protein
LEADPSFACSRRIGAGKQSFVARSWFIHHSRHGSSGEFTFTRLGYARSSDLDHGAFCADAAAAHPTIVEAGGAAAPASNRRSGQLRQK